MGHRAPKVNFWAVGFKPHSSTRLPGMVPLKQGSPPEVGDVGGTGGGEEKQGGREVKTCVIRAHFTLGLQIWLGRDGVSKL